MAEPLAVPPADAGHSLDQLIAALETIKAMQAVQADLQQAISHIQAVVGGLNARVAALENHAGPTP